MFKSLINFFGIALLIAAVYGAYESSMLEPQVTHAEQLEQTSEQFEQIHSIVVSYNDWIESRRMPEDVVPGTRSEVDWRNSIRNSNSEIEFGLTDAVTLLEQNGWLSEAVAERRYQTSHSTLDSVIRFLVRSNTSQRQAFEEFRVEGWRCIGAGLFRQTSIRETLLNETGSFDQLTDCWYPLRVRGDRMGELVTDYFVNDIDLPIHLAGTSFPPIFQMHLVGSSDNTNVFGEDNILRNDVIEFDGFLLCVDDDTRFLRCSVGITRIAHIGEYMPGMLQGN